MSQPAIPPSPRGGALNGTQHAAFGLRIHNAIGLGETESIQRGADGLIARGMDHNNLMLLLPLCDQMSEHGCFPPRQKQFWLSHPGRGAGGKDEGAEAGVSQSL